MLIARPMRHRASTAVWMVVASAAVLTSCQGASGSKPAGKPVSVAAQSTTKDSAVTDTSAKSESRQLVVYYFHGNARCPTCFKLESYAKSEVETRFADAIKNGKLTWKTVNIEDKGNEHYGQDYKLYTKSEIVSTRQGDREVSWRNLEQIWQLVGDETKYRDYINKEVRACLNGQCL